jgi:hypothetical protein
MIPQWLAQDRQRICQACAKQSSCPAKFTIPQDLTDCPDKRHPSKADAIAARAWPQGAERISGCCDPIGAGWG